MLWFFRRTAALFRQIRTYPQLFRFCSDLENSGIRQIVRNSMLTGRWWEGRILINLCGKNNVQNCDLLQSDFFARCRTVLWRQRDFWACVVTHGKRWDPETLWFFTIEKIWTHFSSFESGKVGGIWAGLFQEQISCQIVDVTKPRRATPGYEHRFKGSFPWKHRVHYVPFKFSKNALNSKWC